MQGKCYVTPDWCRKMTIITEESVNIKRPEMILDIFSLDPWYLSSVEAIIPPASAVEGMESVRLCVCVFVCQCSHG